VRFREGMIVKSDAGRDQERFYVVVRAGEGFAYIADGKRRPLEKPKRKNIRHLKGTSCFIDLTQADTNPRLRRALRPWNHPGEKERPAAEQEGIACQNRI
jgi:ribosomal protein L14E/L6E/L27E